MSFKFLKQEWTCRRFSILFLLIFFKWTTQYFAYKKILYIDSHSELQSQIHNEHFVQNKLKLNQ